MKCINDLKKELKRYFLNENTYHLKFAEYFDKEIYYILSQLKNNELKSTVVKVKVYNPLTSNSRPGFGCDICIGGSSVNSKYIYDFKKDINAGTNVFSLKKYFSFTLFNYCKKEQIEEVKEKHSLIFKQTVNEVRHQLLKDLETLNSICK